MATADLAPATARSHDTPFTNEPFIDFTLSENKRAMEDALAKVVGELGREYDIIIGGRRLQTTGKIVSTNPRASRAGHRHPPARRGRPRRDLHAGRARRLP